MTAPKTTSASYEVGYRKPPRHTQFQKGQSGNPGGRPRRLPAARLDELALCEAYRTTVVMEDGHAVPMPAIQAVLRRQLECAASGNVRAQRDILAMIRDIERKRDVAAMLADIGADDDDVDDDDVVDDTDDTEAEADGGGDYDLDDGPGADRDEAGGADDGEPARKQVDGIDTHGKRRQAEPEPTAPPPAVSAPQPENAAAPPDGRMPSLPSGSGSGQSRGVLPAATAPHGARASGSSPPPCGEGSGVGVEPSGATVPRGTTPHPNPPPQGGRESARLNLTPMRRRRGPAVNAGKIREGHSGSSRLSPGRRNAGPGPAQAAGGHARAPATLNERRN